MSRFPENHQREIKLPVERSFRVSTTINRNGLQSQNLMHVPPPPPPSDLQLKFNKMQLKITLQSYETVMKI